jgi:hypothetical protein
MADFPRFPERNGAPGDGALAWYVKADETDELAFGGIIDHLETIDARSFSGLNLATFDGRFGRPLHPDATTIWMKGTLHVGLGGKPLSASFKDAIDAWNVLRGKLFTADAYILQVYRQSGATQVLKCSYAGVRTVFLHCFWHSNVSLSFSLGAYTTDRTLSVSATAVPGA